MNAIEKSRQLLKENEALNAVVTYVDGENDQEGCLSGVPIALKDNVSTKGIRTTASSKILDNYVPVYDATIVTKLKAAGATIVAKTSMDELGMGGTNKNAATGPVHNPHDVTRITGGSSGGSAAVVACGALDYAIGTDTGDSIRKPASYTGVVGVKPTYGRISRYGIIPYASSLDHVGYFAKDVRLAAKLLSVLAGRDDADMTSSQLPVEDYEAYLSQDSHTKVIGVLDTVMDEGVDPYLKDSFNQLVAHLEKKGYTIKHVSMPEQLMGLIAPVYKTIANAEATANHSNLDGLRFGVRQPGQSTEEVMKASRTAGFSAYVRKRFVIGSYSLFEENQAKLFVKAQKIRRLITEAYAKCFEECDVVLSIAANGIAPKIEDSHDVSLFSDAYSEDHMQLANFSGYPAMSIPMNKKEGLPLGVHLAARPFEEGTMFLMAQAIEGGCHELFGNDWD